MYAILTFSQNRIKLIGDNLKPEGVKNESQMDN